MDINQIYAICKENYNFIQEIRIEEISKYEYKLSNAENILEVIGLLESTKYFDGPLDYFKKIIITFDGGKISTNSSYKSKFNEIQERLLLAMNFVIKTYESVKKHEEIMPGLDIRLPINENFTEFRKNIDDLEFVLTKCPFFQNDTENLRFKSVDQGSVLLTFVVTSVGILSVSVLLNNIAAFIDKCLIIRSHYLTIQEQKRMIERSNMEQKAKEEIINALDKTYKILVDEGIRELAETLNYKIKDGDEMGRTEQAVERLNNLIERGMQIYATFGTPEETKALFAPIEMKYLDFVKDVKSIVENN